MRTKLGFDALKTSLAAIVAAALVTLAPRPAISAEWTQGDVFVGIGADSVTGHGRYNVYDNNGNLLETLNNGLALSSDGSNGTTGCTFNLPLTKLYTTDFDLEDLTIYDALPPHSSTTFTVATQNEVADENIVFDASGNFYVGLTSNGGTPSPLLLKFDPMGNLVDSYSPATDFRGFDWFDLKADQCTMLYTGEGSSIKQFDVCHDTQLADFVNASSVPRLGDITAAAFSVRILPNGDVLLADAEAVLLFDSSGTLLKTYTITNAMVPDEQLFALGLDPDGTSFWVGSQQTANLYQVDLASGAILQGPIATGASPHPGTNFFELGGICLNGDFHAALNRCPRSQGFWKRHPDLWPITSLIIGGASYGESTLIKLMARPSRGNAVVILARQLIGAILNLANGSNPVPIASTIQDANDLIAANCGASLTTCSIDTTSVAGQAMVKDAKALDDFNNGGLTKGCFDGEEQSGPAESARLKGRR